MFEGKEIEVLTITVAELKAEIARLKKENRVRLKETRSLANEEIAKLKQEKEAEIKGLENENSTLKKHLELINSLSFEHRVEKATMKSLKSIKKELNKAKKGAEKEIKGAVSSVKKYGKQFRKKTGL